MSAGEGQGSRGVGLVLAAITCATGAYGASFWLTRDTGPEPDDFGPAARIVREQHRAGDLIVLAPFYATRARELLGDLLPVAPKDPLAEDLRAHDRVWVFGLFGAAEALRAELSRSDLTLLESHAPSPKITIDLWGVRERWQTRYDFRANLKHARVFHEYSDGRRESCATWTDADGQGGTGGRWACPHDAEWFYVSSEWHRMGDHPRQCLWAHPPSEGRIVIEYPNVPMSPRLYGRGGHTLNSSLHARERVDLDVKIGDAPPARVSFGLEEHWRPFALSVPTVETATVSFAVSTPDAGANHFCFTAELREAPQDLRRDRPGPHRWRLR